MRSTCHSPRIEPSARPCSISLVRVEPGATALTRMLAAATLGGIDARQALDAGLGGAIGAAAGHADDAGGRGDADDRAALAPRPHAPDRLRRSRGSMPVRWVSMHQVPVLGRHVFGQRHPLDAGIVDQDVDLSGLRGRWRRRPRRRCRGRRRRPRDRSRRRAASSGALRSSEKTLAPSSSRRAAMASPMPRAAPVTTATFPAESPVMRAPPQYISQPPLTLIVAPVM